MFAPSGFKDIASIMTLLNREAEARLRFPSFEDGIEVGHLAWLAWSFGELDFVEDTMFEIAVEAGLFACSPDGQAMQLSQNPIRFSGHSAVEMLHDRSKVALTEHINTKLSDNKETEYELGFDPWADSRPSSFRRLPMCFSRAGYFISLRNFDAYRVWLKEVGYSRIADFPFPEAGLEDAWRTMERRSLCIRESTIPEITNDDFWKKVQYSIYSAVWDNAEEIFAELLSPTTDPQDVYGKIKIETLALAKSENLLSDSTYKFRSLDALRNDIEINELGERAWRRVIDRLRPSFPFISKPGRKS